jgi:HEAT repeat protein
MLAALLFAHGAVAAEADAARKTQKLVAVLQSQASVFEKARACQQLGEVGTPDAVPALAALLDSPELGAYARSGLEGIPDPSAAAALREAAGRLKGPALLGVVNSLGALRDAQAVELLGKLANDPGSGAVKEALLALGNIASPPAIAIIARAWASGSEAIRADVAAANLLAADRQRADGHLVQARLLYDITCSPRAPMSCRVGATRGAILARGPTERVPFLLRQLRWLEAPIRDAALLTIREIADDALANALNAELPQARPELQVQLLLALADCHNAQSVPAIAALADGASPATRTIALRVLGALGLDAAPALVAALQKVQTTEDKTAVCDALKAMKGAAVDDLLRQALAASTTARIRIELIHLLGSRETVKASPEILEQAAGTDKAVTLAALSALQSLAGPQEVPGLIALLKACQDPEVRAVGENALAAACRRSGGQTAGAEAVLSELKQATEPSGRSSWLRVLGAVGYAPALPTLVAAASDPNEAVADNALAQLGRWPDPAPIEPLLEAMDTARTSPLRHRAFVSVLDLATTAADENQVPEATIAGWLRRANPLAQSVAEKRRILGLLGRLKTLESFRLLAPYLQDPDVRAEAASGVLRIAPALAKGPEAVALKTTLEQIAATVTNGDLRNQALRLAQTIPAPNPSASLFDGRSLAGWEGNTNVWRVRDGVIVGGSLQGNPQNEFLGTLKSYTNFFLRLEYKLVGTEGFVNSGVQFRSVRLSNPPNEMKGYQADIGAGYSGCLYDESRRNRHLARPSDDTIKRLEKVGDWNLYEVRGEGRHVQVWLNGEKTVDYTEPDTSLSQEGVFGLQIHGGCKAEVSFRNITVEEL